MTQKTLVCQQWNYINGNIAELKVLDLGFEFKFESFKSFRMNLQKLGEYIWGNERNACLSVRHANF